MAIGRAVKYYRRECDDVRMGRRNVGDHVTRTWIKNGTDVNEVIYVEEGKKSVSDPVSTGWSVVFMEY